MKIIECSCLFRVMIQHGLEQEECIFGTPDKYVFLAPQSRDPPMRNPMYSRATTAQFPTRQYQRAILNHVCQRLVKDRRAVCGTTLTEHCSTSQRNQRHRIVHPLTGRFGVPTTSLLAFIASAFYSPFSSSPWLDLTLPSIYILFPQLVVCHG
jgi:hypothetical protein